MKGIRLNSKTGVILPPQGRGTPFLIVPRISSESAYQRIKRCHRLPVVQPSYKGYGLVAEEVNRRAQSCWACLFAACVYQTTFFSYSPRRTAQSISRSIDSSRGVAPPPIAEVWPNNAVNSALLLAMKCAVVLAGCMAWQQPLALLPRSHVAQMCAAAPAAQLKTQWADLTEEAQRLTDAQVARTVASVCADGVLTTRVTVPGAEGAAMSSFAPFVIDADGCPLMPLSSSEAAANLEQDASASFFAHAPRGGAAGGSSITLLGSTEPVPIDDVDDLTLKTISDLTGTPAEEIAARPWCRLVPTSVHLQDAVRASEAWVPASEYLSAEPNPLAPSATSLLAKINSLHMPGLRRFAAVYAGVPSDTLAEAELLGVDQLGFDLQAKLNAAAPSTTMRIGFRMPPANEEEGISVFMKLFQEAYEREHGFMQ